MIPVKQAISSSVGRKFIMSISGLGLVGFIITHLLGNLTLFSPNGAAFNAYAKKLHDLGPLLTIGEIGILILVVVHVVMATQLKLNHAKARPMGYRSEESKGGPSRSGFASRNMIITGLVLFGFLCLHIWQFRFGPAMEQGYAVQMHGENVRDLYRLVSETFHKPLYVLIYVGSMLFLGLHLRHGFWSAFQSLGAMDRRQSQQVYALGLGLGILLSLGFLLMPFWFYFDLGSVAK